MLKKYIGVYLFILLLGGLLWSRALLSLTILVWATYSILETFKVNLPFFSSKIFLWSCAPLFFWILGAWRAPLDKSNLDYLLTLSTYPAIILITNNTHYSIVKNRWLIIWLFATALSLTYSISWYFTNLSAAHKAYGMGQTVPIFMDTDHVRFSIFLCSSLLFILFLPIISKKNSILFGSILYFTILFLSVRTGWVLATCIIGLFLLPLNLDTKKMRFQSIIRRSSVLVVGLIISYFLFPNMQQKIAYSIWEWKNYQPTVYNATFSDGTRRNINFASWQVIQSNYAVNSGWDSIPILVKSSFQKYFKSNIVEFGWPFNQWLFWWIGSGWWGMIMYSCWLLYPALIGFGEKNKLVICWTLAILLSCLIETTLNYQYGVLLHVLPIAIIWKLSITSTVDNSYN